jgi:Fic family protein
MINKKITPLGYNILIKDLVLADEKDKFWALWDFIYSSNLIEGITKTNINTYTVGEKMEPIPEFDDHQDALEYILENYRNNILNQTKIKEIHNLLMFNLIRDPGNYRKKESRIGKLGNPLFQYIGPLMNNLERKIIKLEHSNYKTKEEIWNIHNEFETIHPFSDGNGRTGRLLLNYLSLRYFGELIYIKSDKRQDYYQVIQNYEDEFKKLNPRIEFLKDKK